jgi:Ion channel
MLGEDFSARDAYWFAYISTTTVGLGDYFLEPEVFTRSDLMLFPMLFLFGFVLLASFLNKFTELLSHLGRRGRFKLSVLESILAQLKTTNMIMGDLPTKKKEEDQREEQFDC